MGQDNTPNASPNPIPTTELTPEVSSQDRELQERLKRVLADDSELQKKLDIIKSHTELLADLQKVEFDPSQQGAFLEKLKGYGQEIILKDGTRYTFVQLLEIGKKDPNKEDEILSQLPEETRRIQKREYSKWKLVGIDQEVNQKKNTDNELGQEVNQLDQQLISLNEATREGVEKAKKLLGENYPKISDTERKEIIEKNPKLKNANPEELRNGKYDNIIGSIYLVQNQQRLSGTITNPEDKIKFLTITNDLDQKLGGVEQNIGGFGRKIDTMVLGSGINAEDIKTRGGQWAREGYSDISFNNQTREFVFRNETTGFSKRINLRGQVAQESVEKYGISIERTAPNPSPEEREKQKLEKERATLTQIVSKDAIKVKLTETNEENIPPSLKEKNPTVLEAYKNTQKGFRNAQTPIEKYESINLLKLKNHEIEKARRESITADNMNDPRYGKMEDALFQELSTIHDLENSLSQYIQNTEELKKYQTIQVKKDGFDDTAKSNLSFLTDMKFHKIGSRAQEALDRVITETNRGRDEKNKIKLNEKSLDESDQRDIKTALEKLGGKPGVFESESRLRTFRLDVEKALVLPSDHPLSLESQINGTYERTYNNG